MVNRTPEPSSELLRYRFIFENAREALAIIEGDGGAPRLNRAARSLVGLDVGKLLAHDGGLADFFDEVRANGHASTVLDVSDDGAAPRRFEVEGTQYESDEVIAIRDVTEAIERQAELSHLRRIESVGLLTASVIHDFNNLLAPIICLSAMLERELGEGTRASAMGKEIRHAAEQAAGLARLVLGTTRRRAGSADAARVDVNVVLTELQTLMKLLVGEGIDVALSLDEAPCEIVVVRERLEHVLFNLVANARDAMPRGGTITLRSTNVPRGECVAIAVTDTGVGMTAEVRARAFERFFTTKELGRGTGLGLFNAHRFAVESKGQISVHSDPGEGTNVMLHLPCA
jgi:signal transduction histidine kinase